MVTIWALIALCVGFVGGYVLAYVVHDPRFGK